MRWPGNVVMVAVSTQPITMQLQRKTPMVKCQLQEQYKTVIQTVTRHPDHSINSHDESPAGHVRPHKTNRSNKVKQERSLFCALNFYFSK